MGENAVCVPITKGLDSRIIVDSLRDLLPQRDGLAVLLGV